MHWPHQLVCIRAPASLTHTKSCTLPKESCRGAEVPACSGPSACAPQPACWAPGPASAAMLRHCCSCTRRAGGGTLYPMCLAPRQAGCPRPQAGTSRIMQNERATLRLEVQCTVQTGCPGTRREARSGERLRSWVQQRVAICPARAEGRGRGERLEQSPARRSRPRRLRWWGAAAPQRGSTQSQMPGGADRGAAHSRHLGQLQAAGRLGHAGPICKAWNPVRAAHLAVPLAAPLAARCCPAAAAAWCCRSCFRAAVQHSALPLQGAAHCRLCPSK